jgi:hypothetical protein
MEAPHTKMPERSPPLCTYCVVQHTQNVYPPPPKVKQPLVGQGPLITVASRSHSDTPHSCRTTLDKRSARRKDTYVTKHNTHRKRTSMPPVGFELTIPASEWQQTHTIHQVQPLGSAKIFKYCTYLRGAVGCGNAPQTGRPQGRFPMVSLEFFIDIILSATLWPWGLLSL